MFLNLEFTNLLISVNLSCIKIAMPASFDFQLLKLVFYPLMLSFWGHLSFLSVFLGDSISLVLFFSLVHSSVSF